jgi:hypothetical protein
VGLIGLWATWRWFPRSAPVAVHRFDGTGYAMLAFGMVAISIALDGLSGMGLGMALVVVLMVFGLASLASYWMHALRVDEPLFAPGCSGALAAHGPAGQSVHALRQRRRAVPDPADAAGRPQDVAHERGSDDAGHVTGSMLVKRIAVRTVQRHG